MENVETTVSLSYLATPLSPKRVCSLDYTLPPVRSIACFAYQHAAGQRPQRQRRPLGGVNLPAGHVFVT